MAAAPWSHSIVCSLVRKLHRGGPLNRIVRRHMKRHLMFLAAAMFIGTAVVAQQQNRVSKSFALQPGDRVVVRAAAAEQATVIARPGDSVTLSGTPTGGAKGYHPHDPNWKETSAADWGLDFVAERHGRILVISTKNEVAFIHHHYNLSDLIIEIPPEIELMRENRKLSGNGAPDLQSPASQQ